MTAWAALVAGSTLTSGTAWDHLNAQGGGSQVVYVDSLSASLVDGVLGGSIATHGLSGGVVDSTVSAIIENTPVSASIADGIMSAVNAEMNLAGECVAATLMGEILEGVI